ncbi:MAG TPA: hypothetical protein VLE95_04900 [Chlamydiales bacterium]|nr:hypothetical protein [Chlamydiales bacterium]
MSSTFEMSACQAYIGMQPVTLTQTLGCLPGQKPRPDYLLAYLIENEEIIDEDSYDDEEEDE